MLILIWKQSHRWIAGFGGTRSERWWAWTWTSESQRDFIYRYGLWRLSLTAVWWRADAVLGGRDELPGGARPYRFQVVYFFSRCCFWLCFFLRHSYFQAYWGSWFYLSSLLCTQHCAKYWYALFWWYLISHYNPLLVETRVGEPFVFNRWGNWDPEM